MDPQMSFYTFEKSIKKAIICKMKGIFHTCMLPWVTPLSVNADNWPIINIQQLGPKCFFGKYFSVGTDICVMGKCLCACVGSLWLLDVLQLLFVWRREEHLTHK